VRLWDQYWGWTGGNIGAMPMQAAITAAVTLLLRKPIKKAWHRAVGDRADIDDIRRAAAAARMIAADLYEHHTGRVHPDAPGPDKKGTP